MRRRTGLTSGEQRELAIFDAKVQIVFEKLLSYASVAVGLAGTALWASNGGTPSLLIWVLWAIGAIGCATLGIFSKVELPDQDDTKLIAEQASPLGQLGQGTSSATADVAPLDSPAGSQIEASANERRR